MSVGRVAGRALGVLRGEWAVFRRLPRQTRVLLAVSTLFVFASPVPALFISAFIMRNSQSVVHVMAFQLASFTAVPGAFYLNGLLMRRFRPSTLYGAGLVLIGVSLFVMTSLAELTLAGLVVIGFVTGVAIGFQWANRNLLTLTHTTDENRNYYFGVESFFNCVSGVLIPLAAGFFITWLGNGNSGGLEAGTRAAYRIVAGWVVAMALLTSALLWRGRFGRAEGRVGVAVRFDRVWCGMLALAALKGIVQVFQFALPAMLVMRLLGGRESALGLIQGTGALAAAVLMYVIGRMSGARHRLGLMAAALALYTAGAAAHAVWFSPVSVLFFMGCLLLSQPVSEWALGPIQMQVVDRAVRRRQGDGYAHLCGYEVGLYAGRLAGGGLFVWVAEAVSGDFALRYVLVMLASVQLLSLPLAREILASMRREVTDAGG